MQGNNNRLDKMQKLDPPSLFSRRSLPAPLVVPIPAALFDALHLPIHGAHDLTQLRLSDELVCEEVLHEVEDEGRAERKVGD